MYYRDVSISKYDEPILSFFVLSVKQGLPEILGALEEQKT